MLRESISSAAVVVTLSTVPSVSTPVLSPGLVKVIIVFCNSFIAFSAKTKILNIVYNASNNELVRTNTIVKGCIVSIDASPFKAWFEKHYACKIVGKGEVVFDDLTNVEGKSKSVIAKLEKRQKSVVQQKEVIEQLASGKLLACISSRPGQCGRADGYILEDEEYNFYHKKIFQKKK